MKKGFTLAELIVVISILAILATIGFVMLGGYNKDARDSKRLADITNIEKSMELFFTKDGIYPDPSLSTTVTYSGAEVWKQGTIGDNVINILGNINYKPVDPLTKSEYSYSLLNTGEKYEIGILLEGNILASILPSAYAASKKGLSFVRGNFNKAIVEVSTGGLVYALAVPTIIVSDLTNPDIMNIISSKKLAFNGYSNIPETYSKLGYKTQGGFDFNSVNPSSTILYQGTNISELSTSSIALKTFSDKLIAAYSGTVINNKGLYKQILGVDTTIPAQINTVISPLINQSLGLNLATTNTVITTVTPSCATPTPVVSGNIISVNTGIPTVQNQAWQHTSGLPCYVTCKEGYSIYDNCITMGGGITIGGFSFVIEDGLGNSITTFDPNAFDIFINGNKFDQSDVTSINLGNPLPTDVWQSTNPSGALYVVCDSGKGYSLDPIYGCIIP